MKLWIINAGGKTIWLSRQTHKWAGFLDPLAGFCRLRPEERVLPPPPLKIELHAWYGCVRMYLADTYVSAVCGYVPHELAYISQIKTGLPVVCHLKPIRFKCLALPLGFSWPYFVPGIELGLSSCAWHTKITGVQGSATRLYHACVCVCCLPFAVTARMQWQQLQFVGNVLPWGPGPLHSGWLYFQYAQGSTEKKRNIVFLN